MDSKAAYIRYVAFDSTPKISYNPRGKSVIHGKPLQDVLARLRFMHLRLSDQSKVFVQALTEIGGYFGGFLSEYVPGKHSTTSFESYRAPG